jgi:ABC-type sugar transport system ATPase subunit
VHEPDAGEIRLRGAPYHQRSDSGSIAFIHQDLGLID